MSHISKIELEIKSLDALIRGMQAGLDFSS